MIRSVLRRPAWLVLAVWAAALAARSIFAASPGDAAARISAVLDDFHDAAAKADFKRYFSHFAEDGVFLGTDGSERWTAEEFKAYAKPHFDRGRGWTYRPRDRHVALSPDGRTAWFDERVDNAEYGHCRGSGVLVRTGAEWKIAQYNLSVPVPNALLDQVVKLIRRGPHPAAR